MGVCCVRAPRCTIYRYGFVALPCIQPIPVATRLTRHSDRGSKDVVEFLSAREPACVPTVEKGTSWPSKSRIFHLPVTEDNTIGLAGLLECHAFPEVFMHLRAYIDNAMLLEWWDAPFGDDISFSTAISRVDVKRANPALLADE